MEYHVTGIPLGQYKKKHEGATLELKNSDGANTIAKHGVRCGWSFIFHFALFSNFSATGGSGHGASVLAEILADRTILAASHLARAVVMAIAGNASTILHFIIRAVISTALSAALWETPVNFLGLPRRFLSRDLEWSFSQRFTRTNVCRSLQAPLTPIERSHRTVISARRDFAAGVRYQHGFSLRWIKAFCYWWPAFA